MKEPLASSDSSRPRLFRFWKDNLSATFDLLDRVWLHNPFLVLSLFLLIALAVRIGAIPPYTGDGSEYFLMTRSLALHGDVSISEGEAAVFQFRHSPWSWVKIVPGHYPLMRGSDGRDRCLHSPAVPALVVPFYWLCQWVSPDAGIFRCYTVFGLWAVLTCWYLLSRFWEGMANDAARSGRRWALRGLAGAVLLFSPIGIYSNWTHSEIGVFFLLCLYFYALERDLMICAALALGVAAAQNPACIFWGALLLPRLHAAWLQKRKGEATAKALVRSVAAIALVPLPMLALGLDSFRLYGAFSLLPKFGSGVVSLISADRTVRFYLDPFFGLIWFYPWIFLGVFAPGGWKSFLWRLAVSVPIAAMSTAVINLHSGMVGLRYLVFVYPAFLFLPFDIAPRRAGRLILALYVLFCLWITYPFAFERASVGDNTAMLRNPSFRGLSLVFRWMPALYNPNPESFIENALRADGGRAAGKKAQVSDTCWLIYVEKSVLASGQASLLLRPRALGAESNGTWDRARFGINSGLTLRQRRIAKQADHYTLDFPVGQRDFRKPAQWPEYLFLKFAHPALEPWAIQGPDGKTHEL